MEVFYVIYRIRKPQKTKNGFLEEKGGGIEPLNVDVT